MTYVVSVVSAKGGSGKTTLSSILLATAPEAVSAVDADPSEGLGRWLALAGSEIPYMAAPDAEAVQAAVEAVETPLLVMDTPPVFEAAEAVQAAIAASDVVLTPCIPSPADVERLATVRALVPAEKHRVVLSQQRDWTRAGKEIRDALGEAGYAVLDAAIPLREALRTAWGSALPTESGTDIWKEIR